MYLEFYSNYKQTHNRLACAYKQTKTKEIKMQKVNQKKMTKADVINTYILNYNKGRFKHNGAAYNRMNQLINNSFTSEERRESFRTKIKN